MTEERLAEIEGKIAFRVEETLPELIAEIRRCWRRIEELESYQELYHVRNERCRELGLSNIALETQVETLRAEIAQLKEELEAVIPAPPKCPNCGTELRKAWCSLCIKYVNI